MSGTRQAAPQTHHRLFARAMGLALTQVPSQQAVAGLIRLSGDDPESLRRAIDCAEESGWRDLESRARATALLELAHHQVVTASSSVA